MRGRVAKPGIIAMTKSAPKSRTAMCNLYPYVPGSFDRCREGATFHVAFEHFDDFVTKYAFYRARQGKVFQATLMAEKGLIEVKRIR